MRNSHVTSLLMVVALLGVSGCTDASKEKSPDKAMNPEPCKKLLGEDGMAWLKSHTTQEQQKMNTSSTTSSARSLFRKQVLAWKPGDRNNVQLFTDSEMCHAGDPIGTPEKDLVITYGPSTLPFDAKHGPDSEKASVALGPDTKLVYRKSRYAGQRWYNVYVRCGVPGASAPQLNSVTLEGRMVDTLTDDPNYRPHLQHLLHSAKVMADGFKCTNNPQIPTTLPSSIKD